jgi:hypothetical protein
VAASADRRDFEALPQYTVERLSADLRARMQFLSLTSTGESSTHAELFRALSTAPAECREELLRLLLFSTAFEPFLPADSTTRPMVSQRLLAMAECLKAQAATASPWSVDATVWREAKKLPPPAGSVWSTVSVIGVKRPVHYFPDVFHLELKGIARESDAAAALPVALSAVLAFTTDRPDVNAVFQRPSFIASVAELDRLRRGAASLTTALRIPPTALFEAVVSRQLVSMTPRAQLPKAVGCVERMHYDAKQLLASIATGASESTINDHSTADSARQLQRLMVGFAEAVSTGARSPFRDAPPLFQREARQVLSTLFDALFDMPSELVASDVAAGVHFDDVIVRDFVGPRIGMPVPDCADADSDDDAEKNAALRITGLDCSQAASSCRTLSATASSTGSSRVRTKLRRVAVALWVARVSYALTQNLRLLHHHLHAASHGFETTWADAAPGRRIAAIAQAALTPLPDSTGANLNALALEMASGLDSASAAAALSQLGTDLRARRHASSKASTTPAEEHVAVAERCIRAVPALRRYAPEVTAAAWLLCAVADVSETAAYLDPYMRVEVDDISRAPPDVAEELLKTFQALCPPRDDAHNTPTLPLSPSLRPPSSPRYRGSTTIPQMSTEAGGPKRRTPQSTPARSAAVAGVDAGSPVALCFREAHITGFGDITRSNFAMPLVEEAFDRLRDVNGYVSLDRVLGELERHVAFQSSAPSVRESVVRQVTASARVAFKDLSEYCTSPSPWVRRMKAIFGPPDYSARQEPYAIVALDDFATLQLRLAAL